MYDHHLRTAAIDHRSRSSPWGKNRTLAEAKAKIGDFVRGHPRKFDVSLSVQFPYRKSFRARYPANYLISLARPTGIEPVFPP
jgi:hypothetical protein